MSDTKAFISGMVFPILELMAPEFQYQYRNNAFVFALKNINMFFPTKPFFSIKKQISQKFSCTVLKVVETQATVLKKKSKIGKLLI